MKAIYAVAGVAVLGLGLAGWAALARGQSGQGKDKADSAKDAETVIVLPRDPAPVSPPTHLPPPSPQLDNVVITLPPQRPMAPPPPPVVPPPLTTQPPLSAGPIPPKSEALRPRQPIL